ncbi:MAG: hypothetical protein RLZZ618_1789 [Pseudomonadota bacterium]|jgi:hypothetical protein
MKFPIVILPAIVACATANCFAQPIAEPAARTAAPVSVSGPASTTPSAEPEASSDGGHWRFLFSPYSYHYSRSDEHRPVWMIGGERQRADSYVLGAVYFSNSFGQDSAYAYVGQRFRKFSAYDQLFAQWTAGIMYGYKGEYADKVPFNHGGFSPGAVLTLGWQFTPRYAAQVNVLGNSALMFQLGVDLP